MNSGLAEKYLLEAAKPNFSTFASSNKDTIEKNSADVFPSSALELQRYWANVYNEALQSKRPGKKPNKNNRSIPAHIRNGST
ncbi:hypothetical protein HPULCUR_005562 [Helicostylum pulchrum]|uniref:Uncharacterized protein n=1 Tax=Helicostylum pulchrum TaxID=562976 RepID=A0ABP9Y1F3_9FUNG